MLNKSIQKFSIFAALAMAATGAFSQTANSSTVNNNQTPATIGVTPQTANEANQKAIQRSDTGTVVRTDGTAAEQAREAANRAQNTNNATGAAGTSSVNRSATDNSTYTTAAGTEPQRRAPRADRN